MKRYLRTKEGKVIDLLNNALPYMKTKDNGKTYIDFNDKGRYEILAESDNILDLIQVGDLIIDYDNRKSSIMGYDSCSRALKYSMDIYKNTVYELYTKQGNNYILQARKNEKGWEVL